VRSAVLNAEDGARIIRLPEIIPVARRTPES
jgi:hypothetical protein